VGGGTAGVSEALGTAGVVCSPTAEGIEHAVGRLLADPDRRAELSWKGRERLSTYNERAARKFVTAWDDALGSADR